MGGGATGTAETGGAGVGCAGRGGSNAGSVEVDGGEASVSGAGTGVAVATGLRGAPANGSVGGVAVWGTAASMVMTANVRSRRGSGAASGSAAAFTGPATTGSSCSTRIAVCPGVHCVRFVSNVRRSMTGGRVGSARFNSECEIRSWSERGTALPAVDGVSY